MPVSAALLPLAKTVLTSILSSAANLAADKAKHALMKKLRIATTPAYFDEVYQEMQGIVRTALADVQAANLRSEISAFHTLMRGFDASESAEDLQVAWVQLARASAMADELGSPAAPQWLTLVSFELMLLRERYHRDPKPAVREQIIASAKAYAAKALVKFEESIEARLALVSPIHTRQRWVPPRFVKHSSGFPFPIVFFVDKCFVDEGTGEIVGCHEAEYATRNPEEWVARRRAETLKRLRQEVELDLANFHEVAELFGRIAAHPLGEDDLPERRDLCFGDRLVIRGRSRTPYADGYFLGQGTDDFRAIRCAGSSQHLDSPDTRTWVVEKADDRECRDPIREGDLVHLRLDGEDLFLSQQGSDLRIEGGPGGRESFYFGTLFGSAGDPLPHGAVAFLKSAYKGAGFVQLRGAGYLELERILTNTGERYQLWSLFDAEGYIPGESS